MPERLLVEVLRADDIVKGDEAIIIEFRGVVESTREGPSGHGDKTTIWLALEGGEGVELAPDSLVLRVVPASAQPTDAQVEAGCLAFERVTQNMYGIEECVRAVLEAAS